MEDNKESKIVTCKICGRNFKGKSRNSILKGHMMIHTGERPHQCDQCDYGSTSKWQLQRHILNEHTTDTPFECEKCDKKFKDKSQLKNHNRTHSNIRSFECNICRKTFLERRNLTVHQRVHSGEKPHTRV